MAPARMVEFMEKHLEGCDDCLADPDVRQEVKKITEIVLPPSKMTKLVKQTKEEEEQTPPDAEDEDESDERDDDDPDVDEDDDDDDDLDPDLMEDDTEH